MVAAYLLTMLSCRSAMGVPFMSLNVPVACITKRLRAPSALRTTKKLPTMNRNVTCEFLRAFTCPVRRMLANMVCTIFRASGERAKACEKASSMTTVTPR